MNEYKKYQKCIYCENLVGHGALGMCNKHYIQYHRHGDALHADKKEKAKIDGYYRDGRTGRREHRLIWEKYYGEKLKEEEVIHHINFIKTDNRIENLWKYPNASEHIKVHREYERLKENLLENEVIVFLNGNYVKRERESHSRQIRVIGSLNPAKTCQDSVRVFSKYGIAPALRARDYKDPPKIITE